jgi:hypothetical protein
VKYPRSLVTANRVTCYVTPHIQNKVRGAAIFYNNYLNNFNFNNKSHKIEILKIRMIIHH